MQDAIPREDNVIDITDGAIFPWWLWVSNLGNRTPDIIGEGIREVHLSRTQEQEVVFNFIRVDNTTVLCSSVCVSTEIIPKCTCAAGDIPPTEHG